MEGVSPTPEFEDGPGEQRRRQADFERPARKSQMTRRTITHERNHQCLNRHMPRIAFRCLSLNASWTFPLTSSVKRADQNVRRLDTKIRRVSPLAIPTLWKI